MFSIEGHNFEYVNHALTSGIQLPMLMDDIGAAMVTSTRKRFEEQKDPDGKAWKPTFRGGAILQDSNRYASSHTYNVDGDSVSWGTNWRWAHVQHFGMVIKAKKAKFLRFFVAGKPVFARQVTIPSRKAIGFNARDKEIVKSTVINHLRIALGG